MRMVEQKILLVTRHTKLEGLKSKFNTASQAKFVIERAYELDAALAGMATKRTGVMHRQRSAQSPDDEFASAAREDDIYQSVVKHLRRDLMDLLPLQVVNRELLPTISLRPSDIIVTVGQDGLVANTAKYALDRPIVAVNPDPQTIDGILLPFTVGEARDAVIRVIQQRAKFMPVTLAEASLSDGQRLLAFNDLFIGCKTHVSARYRIDIGSRTEPQSSSGVLVSTGAGSTGWLSSIFNMAAGLFSGPGTHAPEPIRMRWDDKRLAFVVREPFVSKTSRAGIVSGMVEPGDELLIESSMPQDGVIFSDGVESDFLQFNSGAIVRIRTAKERAMLVSR